MVPVPHNVLVSKADEQTAHHSKTHRLKPNAVGNKRTKTTLVCAPTSKHSQTAENPDCPHMSRHHIVHCRFVLLTFQFDEMLTWFFQKKIMLLSGPNLFPQKLQFWWFIPSSRIETLRILLIAGKPFASNMCLTNIKLRFCQTEYIKFEKLYQTSCKTRTHRTTRPSFLPTNQIWMIWVKSLAVAIVCGMANLNLQSRQGTKQHR